MRYIIQRGGRDVSDKHNRAARCQLPYDSMLAARHLEKSSLTLVLHGETLVARQSKTSRLVHKTQRSAKVHFRYARLSQHHNSVGA